MAANARSAELDMVRGIAILFVVAIHIGLPPGWDHLLRAVALPAFFIVSGYLFREPTEKSSIKELAAGRFRSLLVPYMTACVLSYLLWLVTMFIGDVRQEGFPWYKPLVGIFYGNDPGGWMGLNGPLWFLICLFSAQMLFGLALKGLRNTSLWAQSIVFLAVGLAGWGIGQLVFLPWGLDLAMAALPFLFAGRLLRRYRLLEKMKPVGFAAAASAAVFAATALGNASDMDFRIYGNVALFYLSGMAGTLFLVALAKGLLKAEALRALFSLLGRESLAILIFHYGFVFVALKFADKSLFHDSIPWIAYWVLGASVPLLLSAAIRQVPFLHFLLSGGRTDAVRKGPRRRKSGKKLLELQN